MDWLVCIWLGFPFAAWAGNHLVPRGVHPALLFIGVCAVCYLLLAMSILGEFSGYERELMEYDLNGNGHLENSELTPAAMEVQDKIASDTGRMFGPIFAVPITGVWVTINFAVLYGAEHAFRHFPKLR